MDWRLYAELPHSISLRSQAALDPTLYGPNSQISSRSAALEMPDPYFIKHAHAARVALYSLGCILPG